MVERYSWFMPKKVNDALDEGKKVAVVLDRGVLFVRGYAEMFEKDFLYDIRASLRSSPRSSLLASLDHSTPHYMRIFSREFCEITRALGGIRCVLVISDASGGVEESVGFGDGGQCPLDKRYADGVY